MTEPQLPPTPSWVADEVKLADLTERFAQALERHWPGAILSYSFKTNSLPWLISYLRSRGVWAEVVSDFEYATAEVLGYTAEQIVYNGPIKSRARLEAALHGGSIINLDAKREVRWVAEMARESPEHEFAVGLRVNWDLEELVPGESTVGDAGSRFGFNVDNGELDAAIAQLREAGVRVAGLHMHRNSRTQRLDVFRASASLAAQLIRERQLELDWVDIGGGFFGQLEVEPSFDDYVRVIRECLDDAVDIATTKLIVEPGGALAAVPFELHGSVVDAKHVGDTRFVVTDVSRLDIDPLFRRTRAPQLTTSSDAAERVPVQVISGYTCMEDDRLATLEDAPALAEGDRIVFYNMGAYTLAYQSNFIEPGPEVYVRDAQGELTRYRRRPNIHAFFAGNSWVN